MGVAIYGISYDTPEDNRAWAEIMGFEFPLLSDPDHTAGRALEAERDPDHPAFGVPIRITYLIDPDLTIRRSYRVGREEIAAHPDVVLTDLRAELVSG